MARKRDRSADTFAGLDLGTCCICGRNKRVFFILHLNLRCPTPGKGWGCMVCGVPQDGAVAVFCEGCARRYDRQGNTSLVYACRGFPGTDGRVPIGELTEEFGHDLSKHPELEG